MNSVGLITLCCGSLWFQKSTDSKRSGSGKDNWILERLSPAQSVLFNQELLCSLPIFLQTSSWLREKGVLLSNSSLCNFSPVHDVGILMLLIEEKMKTNISVLPLSFLAVLTRTEALWRSRAGVCRGTGVITGGFLGAAAAGCCLCHPVFPALLRPAGLGCALRSRWQGLCSICAFLSARHRAPCHGTSLTWAIALLSAYRGRKEQGKLGGNKQQKPLWLWLQGVCFFVVRSVSVNQSYCLFICLFSSKMFWFISSWYFVRLFELC